MPDGNKSKAPFKVGPVTGFDPNFFVGINQQAFDNWTRCMSGLTTEISRFLQARLQEDLGIWTKLASCKDLNEALECQNRFVQKAASDYFDEASTLSRLSMSMATEGLSAFRGEAGEQAKAAA